MDATPTPPLSPPKNDKSSQIDSASQRRWGSRRGWRRAGIGGIVVVMLVAATSWGIAVDRKESSPSREPAGELKANLTGSVSVPVRLYRIPSETTAAPRRSFPGVVQARYETKLAFRVDGKIARRAVEVGERVRQGALLFELDAEDYRLQWEAAKAEVEGATASLKRAMADEARNRELLETKSISPSEYERSLADRDVATYRKESAQRQLELAANRLDYCRLVAEADGIITSLEAEVGQVVNAGMRLGMMAQFNDWEAVIDVPENQIPQAGSKEARVHFWSLPDQSIDGRLRELSPIADPILRTYRARFTLISPPPAIKLGMTATVEWDTEDPSELIAIPSTAVFHRDGKPAVWLMNRERNAIALRLIEIARYGDREVLVGGGLQAGDEIVSAGVQKLDEHLPVRPWEGSL